MQGDWKKAKRREEGARVGSGGRAEGRNGVMRTTGGGGKGSEGWGGGGKTKDSRNTALVRQRGSGAVGKRGAATRGKQMLQKA